MTDNGISRNSILIVDDNPTNLDILFYYLDQAGFDVFVAEDGESAIEQVQYSEPDIILLDVLMNGIDGFETCRRLKFRAETKDIPIIFMTALSETADKVNGFEVGAVDFVTKPLQYEEVLARVSTHLTIRRLQRELQEQNIRLRQEIGRREKTERELKARNEELGAFASTVAHDLKSPLQVIIGSAELIEIGPQLSPGQQKDLQKISDVAFQMNQTTDALLLLAKISDTDVISESINMKAVVNQSLERVAHQIQAAEAEIIIPAYWHSGFGYPSWIEEVWANYISNAIKYGGSPPRIELGSTLQADGFTRYWIRDNGRGLSSEEQQQLFTEFTRLQNVKSDGYGLGLSIVQRIVRKLGGRVGVQSKIDQGSVFYFTLKTAADQ